MINFVLIGDHDPHSRVTQLQSHQGTDCTDVSAILFSPTIQIYGKCDKPGKRMSPYPSKSSFYITFGDE
jgi:hypothetical protein